jgi:hypothetical protein
MLLEMLTLNLPAEPSYHIYPLKDINRVTKREKWRTVYNPNKAMRIVQARFQKYLRGLHVFLPHATAIPGFNPRLSVSRHMQNRYFYQTDLRNAFKNVSLDRWVIVLASLDPNTEEGELEEASRRFLFLTTTEGMTRGIVTGGLASVDVFNIYAGALLDKPLKPIIAKHNLVYTRFLDDLTFSAASPIGEKKRKESGM